MQNASPKSYFNAIGNVADGGLHSFIGRTINFILEEHSAYVSGLKMQFHFSGIEVALMGKIFSKMTNNGSAL